MPKNKGCQGSGPVAKTAPWASHAVVFPSWRLVDCRLTKSVRRLKPHCRFHCGPAPAPLKGSFSQQRLFSYIGCVTNAEMIPRNYADDGGRSLGVGLQGQAPNRRVLLRPKDVVVSDAGKVVR